LKPRESRHSPEEIARHEAEFSAYIRGQVEELLTRYGKIDLIWFDGNPGYPHGNEAISIARIRELQPQIVINPRLNGHGDFVTYERKLPKSKPDVGWAELCNTWTAGWPYMEDPDTHQELPYRANARVLGELALCRSWGINYLLDLGPRASGELSSAAYANLAVVGGWMKSNGSSVIGAKPLPPGESSPVPATSRNRLRYLFAIPEFKTGGATAERIGAIAQQAQIPATTTGEYPDQQLPPKDLTLSLTGVGRPKSASLLATGRTLEWAYAGRTVSVLLPASMRTNLVDVVQIELPDHADGASGSQ
jgi:alpha-L-fucosidase